MRRTSPAAARAVWQWNVDDWRRLVRRGKLIEVEEHDRSYLAERVQNRLREWVSMEDVRNRYGLIVVDTAPSDHPLTRAALRAATHLLIPVTMEQQGIDGLHEMLSLWRQENSRRTETDVLQIIAIQPNLASSSSPSDVDTTYGDSETGFENGPDLGWDSIDAAAVEVPADLW